MIIVNGFLHPGMITGGGLDAQGGHPRAAAIEYGMGIPCQFIPESHNDFSSDNGETITRRSYTILIEEQPFDAGRVRLTNLEGAHVADLKVRSVEPLVAVCEVRIKAD